MTEAVSTTHGSSEFGLFNLQKVKWLRRYSQNKYRPRYLDDNLLCLINCKKKEKSRS